MPGTRVGQWGPFDPEQWLELRDWTGGGPTRSRYECLGQTHSSLGLDLRPEIPDIGGTLPLGSGSQGLTLFLAIDTFSLEVVATVFPEAVGAYF